MRIPGLAIIVLLTGCVTEENVVGKVGNTWCRRLAECDRASFEEQHASHGDCVDDFRDTFEPWQECRIEHGCDWEPSEVSRCRSELRNQSCSEVVDGGWLNVCAETYTCSGSQEAAANLCWLTGGP